MKNKKSILGLGLLALVLVLGVGYAVVSNVELDFDGTSNAAEMELKVDIASVEDRKTGNAVISHTLGTDHAKTDTFTITNMSLNETVTMIYTIDSHETDVDATLEDRIALNNNNEEYYTASYTIDNADIAAGESTTVTVTVTMIKTPVVEANNEAEITFGLVAKPVNNANS